MATSQYFNNYNAAAEQRVVEDLIVESIKIMGFDGMYLPNDNDQARDLLYGEDPVKKFQTAFPVEFYLSSSLEYMGEKELKVLTSTSSLLVKLKSMARLISSVVILG